MSFVVEGRRRAGLLREDHGHGVVVLVGDGDEQLGHAGLVHGGLEPGAHVDVGTAVRPAERLNNSQVKAFLRERGHGLEDGFLGGEAPGEELGRAVALEGGGKLALREGAPHEGVLPGGRLAGDALAKPVDLANRGHVDPDALNHAALLSFPRP